MTADQAWHAQMQAGQRGDWDAVLGYFAPDCTWTLMPPGTTFRGREEIVAFMRGGFGASAERAEPDVRNEFATDDQGVLEYTSRGVIDARRAAEFAAQLKIAVPGGDDLAGRLEGQPFEVQVCFVYHVNADGLIDQVNEYAAMPPLPPLPYLPPHPGTRSSPSARRAQHRSEPAESASGWVDRQERLAGQRRGGDPSERKTAELTRLRNTVHRRPGRDDKDTSTP